MVVRPFLPPSRLLLSLPIGITGFLLLVSPAFAELSKEGKHLRMIELAQQMETLKPRIASSPIDAWSWSQKADEYRRLSNSLGGDDPGKALPGGRVASAMTAPEGGASPIPPGCSGGLTTHTNGTDVFIPAGPSLVTSTIVVAGLGTFLWDVNVETFITHRFSGDLDITLESPEGTIVTLTTDNGSFHDDVFNGTIWNGQSNPGGQVPYDSNPGLVADHPYTFGEIAASLVPEESLSAFRGENPNGTWTLTISDDSPSNDGELDLWRLRITTLAAPIRGQGDFLTGPGVVVPAGPAVVTSTINVPNPGFVCRMRVALELTHTANEDLDITLTSPSGTIATISTDNGSSLDDVFGNTVFDDNSDPDGQVPYLTNNGLVTDQFYVDGESPFSLVPEEDLTTFVGEPINGDWTLTISDDNAGDGGALDHWNLDALSCACVGAVFQGSRADARPSGGVSDHNGVAEPGERFVFEPRWENVGASAGEDFDAASVIPPNFPPNWTPLLLLGQPVNVAWRTISSPFCDSPLQCAFSEAPINVTENRLTGPTWTVTQTTPVAFFRHSYDFEDGLDGGVLEISVNGGAFQDILAAGGIFFGGGYTDTLSTCCSNPLSGREAWSGNSGGFVETSVVLPSAAIGGTVRFRFRTGTDTGGAGAGWFIDNLALGGNDVALTGFSRLYFSGSGSGGATFTIPDGTADYGTIRRGGGSPCFEATADCYELSVSTPTSRPVLHWDSIFGEGTSAGVNGTHAVHLGDSFADVPRASLYYRFVETLLHESVTSGCSPTSYCPLSAVLREQMAVFLIISRYGTGPQPPCTTPLFDDVPCTSPYAEYINRISNLGITSGCGGGNYCPTSPVLREQMAVFLLTTLEGSGYTPPTCTTPMFADVPCASVYSRWINEIARRGVTAGCGGGNFCPGLSVTREQMAVFLTTTFTLRLY